MCRDERLLQGSAVAVLRTVESSSAHLFLYSPPYDDARQYNGGASYDYAAVGDQAMRVLKQGGVVVCLINDATRGGAKSGTTARMTVDWLDRVGFRLYQQCIFYRHGIPGEYRGRFREDHEYILIFVKGKKPRVMRKDHMKVRVQAKHVGLSWGGAARKPDGSFRRSSGVVMGQLKDVGSVQEYSASSSENNSLKARHPATFPDKFAADYIVAFTEPGDLVIDPYMGSGTTGVMARVLGRRFLGIDISAEYVGLARERLRVETAQPRVL